MGKKFGSIIGGFLLEHLVEAVVVIAVLALMTGGFNWLHSHNGFLRMGRTVNLNEIIARGDDLPMEEYATLKVKGVLGSYATMDMVYEESGLNFSSSKDTYYIVVLEDMRVITIAASDKKDISALERVARAVRDYNGKGSLFDDPSFPSCEVSGQLTTLRNNDIIRYYQNATRTAGLQWKGYDVTMTVLDATAVRSENLLLFVILPITIVIILLIRRSKKKKAQGVA